MDSLLIDGGELFKHLYSQAASNYDLNGSDSNISIYNSNHQQQIERHIHKAYSFSVLPSSTSITPPWAYTQRAF